eukprot:313813_1
MSAWLMLVSVATILINTRTKLLYVASTWSHSHIFHIQNDQFRNFAESPSFGLLYKKMDARNVHLIIQNLTPFQFIKSQSLCIALSPDQRFIAIGNILRHLYADECTSQKKHLLFE